MKQYHWLFSAAAVALLAFGGVALTGCAELKDGLVKTDKAARTLALTAAPWELEKDSLPGVNQSWAKPQKEITLRIYSSGRFNGCAGVNNYTGTATLDVDARTIKFGNPGVTRMAGPGLEYEQLYLKTLAGVDSYQIADDDLYLYDGNTIVAKFERKD